MTSKTKNLRWCVIALVSLIGFAGCAARQVPHSVPAGLDPSLKRESAGVQDTDTSPTVKLKTDSAAEVQVVATPFGNLYRKMPGKNQQTHSRENAAALPEVSGTIHNVPALAKESSGTIRETGAPGEKSTGGDAEVSGIVLNFDDADLYEVIRTLAELLEINYIVEPNVRGKVTIQTSGHLTGRDLWPVFYQILEANGLTAIREGALYRIVPLKDAPRLSILSGYGRSLDSIPPAERVVMQIVPLKYIDSAEMTKVLTPFISGDGTIIAHGDSNTLLLVDKGINIVKALKLIEVFDADVLERTAHRFFFLKNADAKETTGLLDKILDAAQPGKREARQLIAIERLNAILVIAKDDRVFGKIENYLKTFDAPSEVAQKQIYVYPVRNGAAEELSGLLSSIFGTENTGESKTAGNGKDAEEKTDSPAASNPFIQKTPEKKEKEGVSTATSGTGGTSTLRDTIKITSDTVRNSLIIEAIPSDYRIVGDILKRLDVLPRQVLIEVTVAEISLDDSNELGIEWSYTQGTTSPSINPGGSEAGKSFASALSTADVGLQYMIGRTDRWIASLSALASDNKVNVLASPSVLALDNKEATINISEELPVASSVYEGIGSDSNVTTTNVEYRNTGLLLSVTPHINENGLVSMELTQEVSDSAGERQVAGKSYPAFTLTSVTTSLVVKHDQTIVIGGLISQTRSKGKSGIPVLSKVPLLGNLFGKETQSGKKKELVMLITPRVIVSLDDVDQVTNEFKTKVTNAVGHFSL